MGILEAITGTRVYLDTNIFIYAVEGYAEFQALLNELFEAFDNGSLKAITSELTLAEVLVKPLIENNTEVCLIYENAIQNSQLLKVVPINRKILIESARLRTMINLRLPDAIHGATAILNGCETFLTNDKRLEALSGINVLILSNLLSS
ncbi:MULTISPECIES: type II toxin-antitoxin system VapC family toxin [Okeania]|uniref:Ribonuclease VapC n=1 Tax=Okeania hirsuta TaxID=1458930 RepID=A0A3N6P5Y2_9CYAN|nr:MULTISPECIES: type II toxin-antitoxin system VapC family toxin [Okeania]NES93533.1 type II toxin-antitoxin system VapC family toxin [Okeania sp. SIO2B9]NET74615.1 type II toxin-antitoxin system VapC family toxin [Okeania sp. SIO1F9]RQH17933.1 PIN domain-containing protein [Okeania hirsuta]RQH46439.1 PIN domain-containing protein [Okeania hirsuta]